MLAAPTPDFLPPPCVALVSAEGLRRIEPDMPDGEGSVLVFCGTPDVQDAFHRMEITMCSPDTSGCPWLELVMWVSCLPMEKR